MIEKSLYAAPLGIEEEIMPDIEIEIVPIGLESLEIEIEVEDSFDDNLAEEISEKELTQIAGDLLSDYQDDIDARKDWIQTYVDGLELLGMKIEERTDPWEGACGVYHPLLSEALVKFQAETIMETFPSCGSR